MEAGSATHFANDLTLCWIMSICSAMEQQPPPPWPSAPRHNETEMPPLRHEPPKQSTGALLKKIFGPIILVLVFALKWLAKIKFLIIPLLKFFPILLKTGGSMILMIGVYAMAYGWKWAVGFVLLIFVHECGHVVVAKRFGLPVSAPVFIPFMGAFILLKEAPKNAWIEAQVGIGGPLFGAAGAIVCYGVFVFTGAPLWAALAYSGFLLNLFNLAPVGFLDGGRIVTALSPWLWIVGTVLMVAILIVSFNPLILLLLIMSAPRLFSLFRKRTDEEKRFYEVTPMQRATIAILYFGLAAALGLGMKMIHDAHAAGMTTQ
jgi:Zn-dependent protease